MRFKLLSPRRRVRLPDQHEQLQNNHPDYNPRPLVNRVEMMRSTIPNRLSHMESPTSGKSEVETARDIVEALQNHDFPKAKK